METKSSEMELMCYSRQEVSAGWTVEDAIKIDRRRLNMTDISVRCG